MRKPFDAKARLISRSSRLPLFAGVAVCLLAVNAAWEVARQNLPDLRNSFFLLDMGNTANLVVILVGLMFARSQYAQTIRPSILFHVPSRLEALRNPSRLPAAEHGPPPTDVYLFNAGPGYGVVDSIRYRVSFTDGRPASDWLSPPRLTAVLSESGLVNDRDYYVFHLGDGVALPPVPDYRAGHSLLGLPPTIAAHLDMLEIRIRFRNSLGDLYERIFNVITHLPAAQP